MSSKFRMVAIVEGPGDEAALPALMRNWFLENEYLAEFETNDLAMSTKGCGRLTAKYDKKKHLGIEHYVEIALLGSPDAILIVVDADKECINREKNGLEKYGPMMLKRAKSVSGKIPVSVVIADPEMEMWLLADQETLHKNGTFKKKLPEAFFTESRAGCKDEVSELLGHKYSERADQVRLAAQISTSREKALGRCRSLRKFNKEMKSLVEGILLS